MSRSPGPTLVDFESRSRCALKKRGGRNYWADPSTEAICAVLYDTATQEVSTWVPGEPVPRLTCAVSHDPAPFDRFAADAYGWEYDSWLRTSDMAQRAGLPGGLDRMAKAWLGIEKDKVGSKLTLSLSRASRAKATRGQMPEITDDVRAQVMGYCARDVEIMAEAWSELEPWLDVDADVAAADRAVNDRGVCLDRELVLALQRELARQQDVAIGVAAGRMGEGWARASVRRAAGSPAQVVALAGLPNAQAETLRTACAEAKARGELPHPLVSARMALASVIPGKLVACLDRVSPDGRVRDTHAYYGAHTGRWSSKGIQLHNLPRVSFEGDAERAGVSVDDYIDAACEHVVSGGELTKRDVTVLMRSVLLAELGKSLGVLDYSGIEARANAWAAGDAKALDVFRAVDAGTGPNPYCVMAASIFGRPVTKKDKNEYVVGKAAELGCGYGMGPDKFGATALKSGVDLAALGVDPASVVAAWRTLHAPIVELWKACERGFVAACEGAEQTWAGTWYYTPVGASDVACVLPSGRPIVYREARATRGRRGYDMSYQGRKAWREHVYGGLLVENAVQGLCRDLLADAIVRCEADGLAPVLHVHDELVCEFDSDAAQEAFAEQRRIMSDAPSWADGLPVRLDGFVSRRYRK